MLEHMFTIRSEVGEIDYTNVGCMHMYMGVLTPQQNRSDPFLQNG